MIGIDLKTYLEQLSGTNTFSTKPYENILKSNLGINNNNSKVSRFYEDWPYDRPYPETDLYERIINHENDWKNWLLPVTLKQQRTLDIGCGCGINLILHAKLASVSVGLDLSLNSLQRAHKYLKENKLEKETFLIHGDICNIDLPSKSFDTITCVGVLHHINDHISALTNISRILDNNGILLLGIYHPGGRFFHRLKRKVFLSMFPVNQNIQIKWMRALFNLRKESDKYNMPENIYIRDSYFVPVEKAFSVRYLTKTLDRST